MARINGKSWTLEETVRVLSLYVQIPFGTMHKSNPAVKSLAEELSRTNNSIALKLVNFASLDPYHAKRGVKGMSGATNLDKEVWAQYYGKWEALADAAPVAGVDDDGELEKPIETDAKAIVKVRRGQAFFRRSVLSAYGGRCCLTGITHPRLIRASHIMPWAAEKQSRLDPHNGLALNSLHDAAFDQGFLTLNTHLEVILSPSLKDAMPCVVYDDLFRRYEGKKIAMPDRFAPDEQYLHYHREHRFVAA